MGVCWIEVRYACACNAILNVNAMTPAAACDRCKASLDLVQAWEDEAGLARIITTRDHDDEPIDDVELWLPLEVTVRATEAALCHGCRAPIPETELEETKTRRQYRCACGAAICLRPIPKRLAASWPAGILVGEDEARLDDPRHTRRRPRRRFYSYVSSEEIDRRAVERRTRRVRKRIASFCRESLAGVRERSLAQRRRRVLATFVLALLFAAGAVGPLLLGNVLAIGRGPRVVAIALAAAFLLWPIVLLRRYRRFRELADRAVVVLARRVPGGYVFDEGGQARPVEVRVPLFSARPPAAFVAVSPEDSRVGLLVDWTYPETSDTPRRAARPLGSRRQ